MGSLKITKRFVHRAPRYTLRPNDKHLMRFGLSSDDLQAPIAQTTLINLSETGVAFLADASSDLKVGDVIKVEVPIPSGDQIAWFGRVVRLEEYNERTWYFKEIPTDKKQLLVGVRFEELPEPHSRAIRRGIEQSFLKALRDQQVRRMLYYKAYFLQNIIPLLLYTSLFLAALALIYWLQLPDAHYDAKHGAPWGERFK